MLNNQSICSNINQADKTIASQSRKIRTILF